MALCCVLFSKPIENIQLLLESLDRFSLSIELVDAQTALLDLGVTFKGAQIGAQIAILLQAAVGVGSNRLVSMVAARNASPGTAMALTTAQEPSFLRSQPVSCLPIELETSRRLQLLGVNTFADLSGISEKHLTNQFGELGRRMAGWVRGVDETLLRARSFPELLIAQHEFDFPIEGGELLMREISLAIEQLFTQLKDRYQLATCIRITLELDRAKPLVIRLAFASPVNESARAIPLARERLATLTVPAPISGLHLALEGLVDAHARQLTLDHLKVRETKRRILERANLMQVVWDDPQSRIPERQAHLQSLTSQRGLYLPKPASVATNDGVPHLMRTRSGWQTVDTVLEEWVIEEDWWTQRPILRHYYRVLLTNGAIHRLFHDLKRGRWFQQLR